MEQLQKNLAKESNFVSAVLYVHNGEDMIAEMLCMLHTQLYMHFERFEIICVDDGSTDNSCERIRETAAKWQSHNTVVSIVHMGYYQGLEAAMRAGDSAAIGDFLFEFDDLTVDYAPELLMQVYRAALDGFDTVGAVPKDGRRRTSRLFYSVFNRQFPGGANLQTERFRLVSRRMMNRITGVFTSIPYRKAAYISSGLRCTALEYQPIGMPVNKRISEVEHYRQEIAVDTLILYTGIAYKFSIVMSVIMMCASLVSLFYTVIIFAAGNPVSGWTTTMVVLSGGLFAVFCILTMLIKYMSIMVTLLNKRSNFVVSGVERL